VRLSELNNSVTSTVLLLTMVKHTAVMLAECPCGQLSTAV